VKPNQFVHKLKHLFSWRGNARGDRTFINRIHDDVTRDLPLKCEHLFEAFYHSPITGFVYTTIVGRIQSGEYIAVGIGPSRKLDEEGRKQVLEFLFIDIPEVEIEISKSGLSGVAQDYDILYDRGAEWRCKLYKVEWANAERTRVCSFQSQLHNQKMIRDCHPVKDHKNTRFPYTHKKGPVDFQELKMLP